MRNVMRVKAAIARADACLYRAKAVGRNRMVVNFHDDKIDQAVA
ncbi:hypothetical protein [Octadecabacter antarcticus]|nr:hypothetical protein [Octadecabacter antarcticus]